MQLKNQNCVFLIYSYSDIIVKFARREIAPAGKLDKIQVLFLPPQVTLMCCGSQAAWSLWHKMSAKQHAGKFQSTRVTRGCWHQVLTQVEISLPDVLEQPWQEPDWPKQIRSTLIIFQCNSHGNCASRLPSTVIRKALTRSSDFMLITRTNWVVLGRVRDIKLHWHTHMKILFWPWPVTSN